jgi:hypothetical protein
MWRFISLCIVGAIRTLLKTSAVSMKMDVTSKATVFLFPAFLASTPAIASVDVCDTFLPSFVTSLLLFLNFANNQTTYHQASSLPVSLEVTFAAYLAVLLGTLLPVTFLVTLYFQVRNDQKFVLLQ